MSEGWMLIILRSYFFVNSADSMHIKPARMMRSISCSRRRADIASSIPC